MKRVITTVSVDVDPLADHLAGYGIPSAGPDALVYERAVPRILECLTAAGIRATFFWVARDAERTAGLLRTLVAAGHEVASHTVDHPEAWRRFGRSEVARELRESRIRLEDAAGAPVIGFRSPGWHCPQGLMEELAAAGYRYDASRFPSPLLGVAGALIWFRSRGQRQTALGMRQWFGGRTPQDVAGLREFPVSVTRVLRIPVYHTLRYALGDARFRRTLDLFVAEGHPLSYPLHAVDALGLHEDDIDSRMSHHPGMRFPLAAKLALLSGTLADIARRFTALPFAARLGSP